ncbi:MAG TPA: zinc ribbon domain-containing protein [Pyrinomonadaceae bacterium]|jgi:putative FmdB family regulatory protein|nr:zinc ribbon domain-containing protein [Pyrinomonadaceae bacterium]
MPIYEYECKKCKAHIEVLQKMTDKPLAKCSKCGGRLEKQWSATGFQFVGSGWYVTDYAGKKRDAKEDKKSAATTTEGTTSGDQPANKDGKTTAKESKTASPKTSSSSNTSGD